MAGLKWGLVTKLVEIINGLSEVELISSSSNDNKCIGSPSDDEGAHVVKANRGRLRKGSRVPTRRSERMRLWREGRKDSSM